MADTQRNIELVERQSTLNREERDLLIRLDEKLNNLIEKVTPLADDHETRIRVVEVTTNSLNTLVKVWGSIVAALLGLGEVLLQVFHH